jgi:two-component system, cell cycle sensor histidine kinase PleC
MSIPGEQPDLAALRPDTSPVKRRLAAQYVREARDRLTSSSGTRPAFDHEALRQYAQNRISASLIILLLVTTVGFMSSMWTGVFAAGTWTAAVLVIHTVMITKCRRFLERPRLSARDRIQSNRRNKELAWDGRSPRAWLIFMAERSL